MKGNKNDTQLGVRIPSDMAARLERACEQTGLAASDLIRQGLRVVLSEIAETGQITIRREEGASCN